MAGSDCDESERTSTSNTTRQNSTGNETQVPEDDRGWSVEPPSLEDRPSPESPAEVITPVEELIEQGQYLIDYPSWLAFLGEEKRSQYSKHFISRNDKIWELLATEQRYVELLVMIRDVYLAAFPPKLTSDSQNRPANLLDDLFPCLNDLLDGHTRLFHHLLKAHKAREDHVLVNLGQCFLKGLSSSTQYTLTEAYGQLMFIQSSLTETMNKLKSNQQIIERLNTCERDPRAKRRKITDCYMIIIQRWTKTETLIAGIMSDTIVQDDSTELEDLSTSRQIVQSLLLGAQQTMTTLVHADKLRHFADNLKEDWKEITPEGEPPSRSLLDWMRAPDAVLVNCDKLVVQEKKDSQKICNVEVYGLALKDCFFLLRQEQETGQFTLYRNSEMPPIIIWTKHFGYFRDRAGSPLTFIIIMDFKKPPTMTNFTCATHDEVARWQKVFRDGFDNYGKMDQSDMNNFLEAMNKEREFRENRKKNQELKLEKINQLSNDIFTQWEIRNILYRTFFVDMEGLGGASASRSNSSRSTHRENHQSSRQRGSLASPSAVQVDDDRERVRRLNDRFMGCLLRLGNVIGDSESIALSRSASDVADRRLSSGSVLPPTPEGYHTLDAKKRADRESVTMRSKGKGHLHPHQRKISESIVSSNRLSQVSNFLRSGSKGKNEYTGGGGGGVRRTPSEGFPPSSSSANSPPGDLHRDESGGALDISTDASESSFTGITNHPAILICECQEVGKKLLEEYDVQFRRCLDLEKDNLAFRGDSDGGGGLSQINAKRELESLRSFQKKLEDDQRTWSSTKQKESVRMERENERLIQWAIDLQKKQDQYDEDCKTLQTQIDLYATREREQINRARAFGDSPLSHGSNSPITPVSLSPAQSLRTDGRPFPQTHNRTMPQVVKKGRHTHPVAPVPKDIAERRQTIDKGSRNTSYDSLNGRRGSSGSGSNLQSFEAEHYSHIVAPRPASRLPPHLASSSSAPSANRESTRATLGGLANKLASKTKSKRDGKS